MVDNVRNWRHILTTDPDFFYNFILTMSSEGGGYVSLKSDAVAELSKAAFRSSYQSREFSDVTLVSEDLALIPAHRLVLTAASTFFRTILGGHPSPQHPQPLVHLAAPNLLLTSLLEFIYLGECRVEREQLGHLGELRGCK